MNIAQYLLKENIISSQQLEEALALKNGSERSIIKTLLDMGIVDESKLIHIQAKLFNVTVIDEISIEIVDKSALAIIPWSYIKEHKVVPLYMQDNDTIVLATNDLLDIFTLDNLRNLTSKKIKPVLASHKTINNLIKKIFNPENIIEKGNDNIEDFANDSDSINEIYKRPNSPAVKLVNNIILNAVLEKASAIFIDPLESIVELKYCVDEVIRVKMNIPKNILKFVIARLKVMADLDVLESEIPQDGSINIEVNGDNVNFDLSITQTSFGERAELNVVDKDKFCININKNGMKQEAYEAIKQLTSQGQGVIIVCGSTGTFRTSSLFCSSIKEVNNRERNIITLNEPYEFTLEGIKQSKNSKKIGSTFSTGLMDLLKKEPDVVLVGEMTDMETTENAFQASLAGRLVFNSIDADNSISVISKLRSFGVKPYMINTSLLGIVSQKLVRAVCPHCKQSYIPDFSILERFRKYLKGRNLFFHKGKGCNHCNFTGFKGHTGVLEVLVLTPEIKNMIKNNASEETILQEARKNGFLSLIEDGVDKALNGLTTLDEIERVIINSESFVHETTKVSKFSLQEVRNSSKLNCDFEQIISQLKEEQGPFNDMVSNFE